MWPFWLMFLVPALAVLAPRRLPAIQSRVAWLGVGALFAAIIGLRHEVGSDWFSYLGHLHYASDLSFAQTVALGDPGHYALNWLVSRAGGDIYWVNLVYALVLMAGTLVFCRRQPNSWLALLVAVPYMLIVVGMGYTRQSVALGFALVGLVAMRDGHVRQFVLWVVVGALFHKSAVLLLPIAALASSHNRWLTGALVLATTLLMYYLLLDDSADAMWSNYVEANRQSSGGAIRVAMNAVPAMLLLLFRTRLAPDSVERRLWLWMALFALLCVPLVGFASTAVDRVALYLIPLQVFVFTRLPRLATSIKTRTALVLGVICYYATVQFAWFHFASHAGDWLPYQFMPLT